MELSIIVSCLVGLWLNWSFLVQTKHKWETKLYILRQLIVFQVTANSFNLSVHLILLIPWPFWGYAVRPGDYLWTVDPLTCRLITAVLEISCIVCILNAAGIFLSNQGKDELRKERLGNNAAVVVSATCFLSGILTLVYTTAIPLLKQGTLHGKNCPTHSFSVLCAQTEVKAIYLSYVVCSLFLFILNFPPTKSRVKYILDVCFKLITGVFHVISCFILFFGVVFIVLFILGGSLYSDAFNIVKLYFDIVGLAVSIGFPAIVNTGFTSYVFQPPPSNRNPDNEKEEVKVRINVSWLFHSRDHTSNSHYWLPYNFYDVCLKNLVLDQLINYLLVDIFLFSHHISAWNCINIVRRNFVPVTHEN